MFLNDPFMKLQPSLKWNFNPNYRIRFSFKCCYYLKCSWHVLKPSTVGVSALACFWLALGGWFNSTISKYLTMSLLHYSYSLDSVQRNIHLCIWCFPLSCRVVFWFLKINFEYDNKGRSMHLDYFTQFEIKFL